MREIVTLQVGQCGNQVGSDFWELLTLEHGINFDGIYHENLALHPYGRINVFFSEIQNTGRHVPRSVLIDTEPGTLDLVRSNPIGKLFAPDAFIAGQSGAGNNFAKGHFTEGHELIDQILDKVRHEVECCDNFESFQLLHSLGGGTGSGLGTMLISKLKEEYPDRILSTFSIVPSARVSDSVIEPYNSVLSLNQLIENADQVFTFDNEALYNIILRLQNQQANSPASKGSQSPYRRHHYNNKSESTPTYNDLNSLIAQAMIGVTSSLRFGGNLNTNYRKIGTNLTPFPRLHFYILSQTPLMLYTNRFSPKSVANFDSRGIGIGMPTKNLYRTGRNPNEIADIVRELFDPKFMMSGIQHVPKQTILSENHDADGRIGRYLTAALLFRGSGLSTEEVYYAVQHLCSPHSIGHSNRPDFVPWIPSNNFISLCSVPPLWSSSLSSISATMVANSTGIVNIWSHLLDQFQVMFQRKAFVHWYTMEGMEEYEFLEAEKNLRDLVGEYQAHQDASNDFAIEQGEENEEGRRLDRNKPEKVPLRRRSSKRLVKSSNDDVKLIDIEDLNEDSLQHEELEWKKDEGRRRPIPVEINGEEYDEPYELDIKHTQKSNEPYHSQKSKSAERSPSPSSALSSMATQKIDYFSGNSEDENEGKDEGEHDDGSNRPTPNLYSHSSRTQRLPSNIHGDYHHQKDRFSPKPTKIATTNSNNSHKKKSSSQEASNGKKLGAKPKEIHHIYQRQTNKANKSHGDSSIYDKDTLNDSMDDESTPYY